MWRSSEKLNLENALEYLTSRGYAVEPPQTHGVWPLESETTTRHSLCDGLAGVYTSGIHIGSIFLILGVSALGTAIPIASKFLPALNKYPFVFTVAKTAATGVLLSVSTIHLIYEGAQAFSEPCMDPTLKLFGPAYFLFALVAALLMQLLDIQLNEVAEEWLRRQNSIDAAVASAEVDAEGRMEMQEEEVFPDAAVESTPAGQNIEEGEEAIQEEEGGKEESMDHRRAAPREGGGNEEAANEEEARCGTPVQALAMKEEPTCTEEGPQNVCCDHHKKEDNDAHGHQHLAVAPPRDMDSIQRVISAVCMEFGVTLHSVFVGLAVGLTPDTELKPLLVALVFHQMFEGMAMGSRLADAGFAGNLEIILALVFSVSAPLGMAVATIAVSVSRDAMAGTGFVTMLGVLDSLCGGILLYLAFTLLLGDFVVDLKYHCARGKPHRILKKVSMFVALWIGMGVMALIGNWL